MSIVAIIIALVLIFLAWKVLAGIVKVGAILLIVVAAAWFLSQGGVA